MNAAGWNIALQPRVSFTEHPAPPGFRFPFTVPDRLWRLEAPACFRTIKFFDLIDDDNEKFWWDLSIRADRKLVYERLVTYGSEAILVLHLDGALLIDLWNEMEVPEPMRTHWAAVIEATLRAPIAAGSEQYRRDDDTRRTPLEVVEARQLVTPAPPAPESPAVHRQTGENAPWLNRNDGTEVPHAEALVQWASVAYETLKNVAHNYNQVIGYAELSQIVQSDTDLWTNMLVPNWIGQVLEIAAQKSADVEEPPLTSLCLHADGTIGDGYDRRPEVREGEYRSRHRTPCRRGPPALLSTIRD